MAIAEGLPAAAVVLLSYPLHPPGKPERLRIEHFPELTVPVLFVNGDRDPFGTPEELAEHTPADRRLGGGALARRPAPRPETDRRRRDRRRGRPVPRQGL